MTELTQKAMLRAIAIAVLQQKIETVMSLKLVYVNVQLQSTGRTYDLTLRETDDIEADEIGKGSVLEDYPMPEKVKDHTDLLDLALSAISRIENRPVISDLTTDGDHNDCEAIFRVGDERYYTLKVRTCLRRSA